jgi:hypothetical protein
MRRRERGAALLEFALAMPFAVLLFAGIADFGGFFWQQAQMEEVSRRAAARIGAARTGYATAGERETQGFAGNLETELRQESGRKGLRVQYQRRYACPEADGGERELRTGAANCPGERVYVTLQVSEPTAPLLSGLRHLGFPRSAESRHAIRVR